LFGQATLKHIWDPKVSFAGPQMGSAQVGPFASEKDAVAACRVLQAAADIQCFAFSGLK
jgi:hypothetical protein